MCKFVLPIALISALPTGIRKNAWQPLVPRERFFLRAISTSREIIWMDRPASVSYLSVSCERKEPKGIGYIRTNAVKGHDRNGGNSSAIRNFTASSKAGSLFFARTSSLRGSLFRFNHIVLRIFNIQGEGRMPRPNVFSRGISSSDLFPAHVSSSADRKTR
jgi:hypothetical protein